MEGFKEILDQSSIHGISYISSQKRFGRLFWIFIVLIGFTGAFLLIRQSFNDWEENPISTTSETLPMSHITFPNITVCPPRNSYLNMNFDMIQSETSRKWLTVAIFRKQQDSSVALWIEIAVILNWRQRLEVLNGLVWFCWYSLGGGGGGRHG